MIAVLLRLLLLLPGALPAEEPPVPPAPPSPLPGASPGRTDAPPATAPLPSSSPAADDGPLTVLGAEVVGKDRVVIRGTLEKVATLGLGVDVATVAVLETLWGAPPEAPRVRLLSNEAGYFARISPSAVFFLEPMEGRGRYACRAVVDGGGPEGAARLAAVRRSLEVEKRPAAGRAAALRALCFEGLGAPDPWTRLNAAREVAHLASIRPGAFTRKDLEDLRKTALRARDPVLRPLLIEATESLSAAAGEDRLAPPDSGAVTLAGAPLLRLLREAPDPRQRRAAAEAAAREGRAGEAALLEALAGDADAGVRVAAAEALGGAGTAEGAGAGLLARAREDRDPAVRAAAVESLGLLGAAAAVGDLRDLVRTDPLLARPAAFALARIRTPGALDALRSIRDEAAPGGEIRAAVEFLLSADFVRQEEALRRLRAAEGK